MIKNSVRGALTASIAATVLVLAPAVSASAATPNQSTYCWGDVSGAHACAGSLKELKTTAQRTYGLQILETAPTPSQKSSLASTGLAAAVLLVELSDGASGGGSYYMFTGPQPCAAANPTAQISSLGGIGWNDRVSSFRSENNCKTTLWKDDFFAGSSYGPVAEANSLGSMDNQASSLKVHY